MQGNAAKRSKLVLITSDTQNVCKAQLHTTIGCSYSNTSRQTGTWMQVLES